MTKENKNPNVPNLRFMGFSEIYITNKLGSLVDSCGGGTPSTKNIDFWNGNIPWISSSDIEENNIQNINITRFITSDAINNSATKLCPPNSIHIVSRVGVGKVAVSSEALCTSQDFFNITKFNGNHLYLAHLLQIKLNNTQSQGTSIKGITSKDLKALEIKIPSVSEQNKIASFLSKIDEQIQTQIKIIEGYKSLINGIIETVLLNSMGEEISLQTVLSEQKEYSPKNNDYPHVTLSKDGIYEKGERYDRDFLVKNEEKEYKVSHYNDICYNPANLKFGVITINKFGDCIFSPIYVTFKINKKYNPDFIALCICRNNFINRARKFEQGTVYERMSVSPDDLLSMTIKLPSLEMQNTIVNNVTSIKNKIMIEEKFLKALNDEKRYLLNNLFI